MGQGANLERKNADFRLGKWRAAFGSKQDTSRRSRSDAKLIRRRQSAAASALHDATFINDPLCFQALKPQSMQSFLDVFPRLADPQEIREVRDDLPVYIFSGSDDPLGQKLEGVRVLIDRYRGAGLTSITHDLYTGGRHEMLHEVNRRDVITNLLIWISAVLDDAH